MAGNVLSLSHILNHLILTTLEVNIDIIPILQMRGLRIWLQLGLLWLPSMGSHRVGHDWSGLAAAAGLLRRRQWHPTPVLMPGKSHGQRSLVGCSPWGREESDTTERLHFHFSLSCTGEGNGSPLQCSCLENPRVGGAWWAAVYGVAQSRTRLKWLSSSSSSRGTKIPISHTAKTK